MISSSNVHWPIKLFSDGLPSTMTTTSLMSSFATSSHRSVTFTTRSRMIFVDFSNRQLFNSLIALSSATSMHKPYAHLNKLVHNYLPKFVKAHHWLSTSPILKTSGRNDPNRCNICSSGLETGHTFLAQPGPIHSTDFVDPPDNFSGTDGPGPSPMEDRRKLRFHRIHTYEYLNLFIARLWERIQRDSISKHK